MGAARRASHPECLRSVLSRKCGLARSLFATPLYLLVAPLAPLALLESEALEGAPLVSPGGLSETSDVLATRDRI
eukprot:992393-Prorocentrum_minimum.AAC.5